MNTYKVKLIMSEEYIITADSEEEAEKEARDTFGCNYYIDDVEITEMKRSKWYVWFKGKEKRKLNCH